MKILMTGNEALARGAWEAGVRFASAYPGTPSTEILENLLTYDGIYAEWAPNEKVALEAACGAAVGGVRAVSAMKHVGVNVAADPLFTFAYTGVNAGMVLVTADEPGMHSSQNEQDNRNYAHMAKIPLLEPSNSQECLDMMKIAFVISEEFDTPVLIRTTTRVAHSKSLVTLSDRIEIEPKPYEKNVRKFLPIPAFAVGLRVKVEERMARLKEYSETTPLNYIEKGGKIGVITSGMCYNYAKEVFGEDATYLKLGFTKPRPNRLLDEFYKQVDPSKVYVIEENDPYLLDWVKRSGYSPIAIEPPYGEKTPDVLRAAIFGESNPEITVAVDDVPNRPPVLCAGCPHRGFFVEIAKRKNTVVAGDIGCYTLGFAPPFNAVDYVICMGSAFSAGHGTQVALDQAGADKRVVAVMGDSTFFHTGMNSLVEVLYNKSRVICVILDNRITGMTGQQEHPGTGKSAYGDPAPEIDIAAVCRALGAEHVTVINPNDLSQVKNALDEAYDREVASVIITRYPCVLKPMGEAEFEEFGKDLYKNKYEVNETACIGCKACIRVGCPAISMSNDRAIIDNACVGCSVCEQICPVKAIKIQ
ncbi:MAG: indolepyruvate ferredoxin oxidoreductase subunit alpha [Defluviitaleaceae bacterium]|nr:indolepyruvate ferredoxin oxidoreductase subunit alpha [Defluviitaleaceae bacterium]